MMEKIIVEYPKFCRFCGGKGKKNMGKWGYFVEVARNNSRKSR